MLRCIVVCCLVLYCAGLCCVKVSEDCALLLVRAIIHSSVHRSVSPHHFSVGTPVLRQRLEPPFVVVPPTEMTPRFNSISSFSSSFASVHWSVCLSLSRSCMLIGQAVHHTVSWHLAWRRSMSEKKLDVEMVSTFQHGLASFANKNSVLMTGICFFWVVTGVGG